MFTKPVDTSTLGELPEDDQHLATRLSEFFCTHYSEQGNKSIWFTKQRNHGNSKDHTSIRRRFLNELYELERKEKVNMKADIEWKKVGP